MKIFKLILWLFILTIISVNCAKEKEGSVVFWHTGLATNDTIIVIVSDGSSGSITDNYVFEGGPDCGADGCYTLKAVEGEYSYTAHTKSNSLNWSGSFKITGNECLAYEFR